MPPSPARARRARLRRATTLAPSSRVRAPETTAAAISPWLWPTTASGRTPQESQRAASDTITANSAGCTTSTRSRDGAPGSSRRTARSEKSVCGARAAAQASRRSRNASLESRSSRAMPGHWEPWPGKTRAVRPSAYGPPPSTRPGAATVSGRASASSASRSAGRPSPRSTARCSKAARVVARESPMSAGSGASSASRRPASAAAASRRAAGVRPESTQGFVGSGAAGASGSGSGSGSGRGWEDP